MRIKTLVTFHPRMPRKTVARRGGGRKWPHEDQGEQSPMEKAEKTGAEHEESWRPSKCGKKDLLCLAAEKLLQEKDVVKCVPPVRNQLLGRTSATQFFLLLLLSEDWLSPLGFLVWYPPFL